MGHAASRVVALVNPFVADAEVTAGEVDVVVDAEQTQRTMNIGSFFGTHFLMGGERYDTPKPDTFLFGDNSDLELLGNKPVQFPYHVRGVSDSVSVLNALVNVRRDSVKFVKLDPDVGGFNGMAYRLEFLFDCDTPCYIQVHFCAKEIIDNGVVQIISRYPALGCSEFYRYEMGAQQLFDKFIFRPHRHDLKAMRYEGGQYFPIVIELRTTEQPPGFSEQVQTTLCSIERSADQSATLVLKPLKQKLIVDGVTYLQQEIFGIENKEIDARYTSNLDENGAECIICMANPRDTVILPCRHLCICNGCAETLRYKLNNCPICRSPFKALLKLKAIRAQADHAGALSGSLSNRMRQQPATLIEALNGPYHPPSLDGRALPGKDAEQCAAPAIGSKPPQITYGLSERITAQNLQTLRRNSASDNEDEQIELEDIAPFRPGYADDRFGTPTTKHGTVCSTRTGSRSDEATDSELQPLSRSSSSVKRDYSDETVGQDGDPYHATLVRVESELPAKP